MFGKIGFIGCGNMGGILARAVAKSVGGSQVAVCDKHEEKLQALVNDTHCEILTAQEIAATCRFVVLGVKPQVMQQTLAPLAPILAKRTDVILISMAAGISISTLQDFVSQRIPAIRIMPNTPALLGEGMILYSTHSVTQTDEKDFCDAFAKAGKLDKLDESQMDVASALSGCGPAYVYAFAEALIKGAIACGLPQDKATAYTQQTLLGASKMLDAFGDAASLRKAVCSPGGTTLAGLKAMEEGGFTDAVAAAIPAAYQRALELQKQ